VQHPERLGLCKNAYPIPEKVIKEGGVEINGLLVGGKSDLNTIPPCAVASSLIHAGSGAWFAFKGEGKIFELTACPGSVKITFDPIIEVYQGSDKYKCANLDCIVGGYKRQDCFPGGDRAPLSFFAKKDQMYYVLLDSFANKTGNYNLRIEAVAEAGEVVEVEESQSSVSEGVEADAEVLFVEAALKQQNLAKKDKKKN
jgi:hypothetical protein